VKESKYHEQGIHDFSPLAGEALKKVDSAKGVVNKGSMIHVPLAGEALKPGKLYRWGFTIRQ
jgi:hypothetical protein